MLVLMAYELFEQDATEILPQAYAVELFHNFSLIHDDIMDNAALRRGNETIHKRFGLPTAILSGDAMLIYAYEELAKNQSKYLPPLLSIFNKMAIGVCEGQQLDLDFEQRDSVTSREYIQMIEKKTSLLLGTALQIGALLAGAEDDDISNLYHFGINTGISFQLLDDVLDAFGDVKHVGKTPGGDILQNKKTILLLEALKSANPNQSDELARWYSSADETGKIKAVTKLFVETGAERKARELVDHYHQQALNCLSKIKVPDSSKSLLKEFSDSLINRVR